MRSCAHTVADERHERRPILINNTIIITALIRAAVQVVVNPDVLVTYRTLTVCGLLVAIEILS